MGGKNRKDLHWIVDWVYNHNHGCIIVGRYDERRAKLYSRMLENMSENNMNQLFLTIIITARDILQWIHEHTLKKGSTECIYKVYIRHTLTNMWTPTYKSEYWMHLQGVHKTPINDYWNTHLKKVVLNAFTGCTWDTH